MSLILTVLVACVLGFHVELHHQGGLQPQHSATAAQYIMYCAAGNGLPDLHALQQEMMLGLMSLIHDPKANMRVLVAFRGVGWVRAVSFSSRQQKTDCSLFPSC